MLNRKMDTIDPWSSRATNGVKVVVIRVDKFQEMARQENKFNQCPIPTGTLLIIGGAENKGEDAPEKKQTPKNFERLEVLKKFIELTEKKDPVIEVVTTASSEGDESFEDYRKAFEELKVSQVGQIHHNERKEVVGDENLLERIR